MRITSDGKVGIGNIIPTELLDVNGTARLRGATQDNSLTRELATDTNGKIFWKSANVATQNFVPNTGNTWDLGSSSFSFKDIYINGKMYINNVRFISSVGTGNTFVGLQAGASNSGVYDTFIGVNAGLLTTTGSGNTYLGAHSGISNLTGSNNTFVGVEAGRDNLAYDNTFVGVSSGRLNTNGYSNTFIGEHSGSSNTTGIDNVALGHSSGPAIGNLSNTVTIGSGTLAYASNAIVLGNGLNVVGIRQSFPAYPLHVLNAYCDGSTWYNASDKNLKKNFRSIQNESILDKLAKLQIERWTYKADSMSADHIGPTAQDFNEVFNLGSNKAAISTVDEIGIALAAIQELNNKTRNLEELVSTQKMLIANLLNLFIDRREEQTAQNDTGLQLYQNSPNPFREETEIKMFIPMEIKSAVLFIYDINGKQIDKNSITPRGHVSYRVQGRSISAGLYIYTLLADDKCAGIKRMILTD